jgi:hypothetical protein
VLRLGWPVCCWCIGCAELCGLVAWVLRPCMPGSAVCTVACGLLGLFPCPEVPSLLGRLGGRADVASKMPSSGSPSTWEEGRVLSLISSGLSLGDRLTGKSCPPPDLERHEPLLSLSFLVVGLLLLFAVGVCHPVYNISWVKVAFPSHPWGTMSEGTSMPCIRVWGTFSPKTSASQHGTSRPK